MSYYDDSSLFVAPNGYKTSVLFAQKPMDANGQLAFTRSNDTATRVAENGLIQKVRTNLVLQSETFQTTWSGVNSSISVNSTTAPNGTLTADKLLAAVSVSDQHRIDQTPTTAAGSNTFSVYAKKGEIEFLFLRIGLVGAYFNLNDGSVGSVSAGIVASSVDAGNGWYRCIINKTAATANEVLRINLATAFGVNNFIGNGTDGAFIWGSQYELNDIATDYIPTTTTAVSVGPVANVPRIDYTGGGCGKLLLEPQRTNVLTFSENFDNAAWTKSGSATTITANSTVSPSGYQDADTWTISSAGARYVSQTKTLTAGAVTASFFVKKGTSNWFAIYIVDGGSSAGFTFNVSNGTLGSAVSSSLTPTASIQDYGNGWYRCVLTATVVGTSIEARGYVATSSSTVSAIE